MQKDQIRQGRLAGDRSGAILHFLASMEADRWIAEADLLVDMAHLLMLRRREIIGDAPARALMAALLDLYEQGLPEAAFDERFEDVHAGKEAYLIERVGEEYGGRLHMGRSRNDEVATCIRIRLRDELLGTMQDILHLRLVLLEVAARHTETIMPGFTHLQYAQPTTLAHHLLAYEQAFSRDFDRLRGAFERVDASPLGSAAFASTGFPIDREYTACLLGFPKLATNTMDAVSARDFALEAMSDASICMTTASRLCEELIVWSTAFARFIQLDDPYCSSSSIMPQKKNPDTAEIMRAKAGSVAGELVAALTIVKGLPMSYNRDLQELTPHLWRAVEATRQSLPLLAGMIESAAFNVERMYDEAGGGFSTATELADTLVREFDLPFRTAHRIVGRAVRHGSLDLATLEAAAVEAAGLSLVERGLTEERVGAILDARHGVGVRNAPGGPSPEATAAAVLERKLTYGADAAWALAAETAIASAKENLVHEARRLIA
ncbi:argininosuccinate lyase [Methanoculleus taiwanensis]|uniref:Argininosuccinate lyase n=1 Tax=Methanoculleus taiwanensis TaxID=1550565 RepID=A0A498GZQ9_9EURY|nr:argininosuccinate lyase [Methanoculleus taiwanensis]RXE56012.1 argininosuccinate lyase [Methanoculleus taiwanensis]